MTEIAGGRWDNLLARLFPIKGRPISPSMSPEIQPVVVVQPDEPELGLLRNERLYASAVRVAPGGGNLAQFLLRNPATSNGLIVLERVLLSTEALCNLDARLQPLPAPPVDLATIGNPATRDTRQAMGVATSAVPGFGIFSVQTALVALAGAIIWNTQVNAAVHIELIGSANPIVLGPNTAFALQGQTVNVAVQAAFFWRERPAEPSEL